MSETVAPVELRNKVALHDWWESTTSAIPTGEICLEKVHNKAIQHNMKIGLGSSTYSQLPYFGVIGYGNNLPKIIGTKQTNPNKVVIDMNDLTMPGCYFLGNEFNDLEDNQVYSVDLHGVPTDFKEIVPNWMNIKVFSNSAFNKQLTQIIAPCGNVAAYGFLMRVGYTVTNNNVDSIQWNDWKEILCGIGHTDSWSITINPATESVPINNIIFGNNDKLTLPLSGYYLCTVKLAYKSTVSAENKIVKMQIMSTEDSNNTNNTTIFDKYDSEWKRSPIYAHDSTVITKHIPFIKSSDPTKGIVAKIYYDGPSAINATLLVTYSRVGPN